VQENKTENEKKNQPDLVVSTAYWEKSYFAATGNQNYQLFLRGGGGGGGGFLERKKTAVKHQVCGWGVMRKS